MNIRQVPQYTFGCQITERQIKEDLIIEILRLAKHRREAVEWFSKLKSKER